MHSLAVSLALAALLLTAGCRGVQWGGAAIDQGQYPPGAGVGEYFADLRIETKDSGSLYGLQDKDIWVRVKDGDGDFLLADKVQRRAGMVEGKATWTQFENLEVELFEVGSASSRDSYARARAKSGPRSIAKLKYRYDDATKRFIRVR